MRFWGRGAAMNQRSVIACLLVLLSSLGVGSQNVAAQDDFQEARVFLTELVGREKFEPSKFADSRRYIDVGDYLPSEPGRELLIVSSRGALAILGWQQGERRATPQLSLLHQDTLTSHDLIAQGEIDSVTMAGGSGDLLDALVINCKVTSSTTNQTGLYRYDPGTPGDHTTSRILPIVLADDPTTRSRLIPGFMHSPLAIDLLHDGRGDLIVSIDGAEMLLYQDAQGEFHRQALPAIPQTASVQNAFMSFITEDDDLTTTAEVHQGNLIWSVQQKSWHYSFATSGNFLIAENPEQVEYFSRGQKIPPQVIAWEYEVRETDGVPQLVWKTPTIYKLSQLAQGLRRWDDFNSDGLLDLLAYDSVFEVYTPRVRFSWFDGKTTTLRERKAGDYPEIADLLQTDDPDLPFIQGQFRRPTAVFRTRKIPGFYYLADLNRDGWSDLVLLTLAGSTAAVDELVTELLKDKIEFQLSIYMSREDAQGRRVPEQKPSYVITEALTRSALNVRQRSVLLTGGDFDGDGWEEFAVRLNQQTMKITSPHDPQFGHTPLVNGDSTMLISDLNNDGRDEFIAYSPRLEVVQILTFGE
jgi:hypothetical protein